MSHVHITTTGAKKQITVDGRRLGTAIDATVRLGEPGTLPTMTVTLLLPEVVVDGDLRVLVDEYTRKLLLDQGWTPPEE